VLQQYAALPPRLWSWNQGCTHMCGEKNETTHVRRSRCAIPYTQPSARACVRACLASEPSVQRMRAGYVLYSLECLECGVVGKCCSNVPRSLRAYGVGLKAVCALYERRTRQRTCVDHDARFHTHNRVRRACRHTKYKHVSIPCTYTYLHFSAQRNSKCHAQMRPTTTHSCEQAMYCTHWNVWSVELWASAAAMCCAPSAPMELERRLYAHMCVRRTRQRTCVDHDAQSHTHNRVREHAYVHTDIPNTNTHTCLASKPSVQRMQAGNVLCSLECLERRDVGKCCSKVLRSLIAYGVVDKAVRTCV
jgi:hypothetical protein